jgi:hypothetical protein
VTESTSDMKDTAKPLADTRSWLRDRLLHECEVMATHALSSGVKVPDPVVRSLAVAMAQALPGGAKVTSAAGSDSRTELRQTGNDTLQQYWPGDGLRELAFAHNRLVELVAPATPRTIQYLYGHLQRPGVWGFLGKVPFVRRSMFAAILFLLSFVLIRVSPHVNVFPEGGSTLESARWPLLLQELYYLAAAGLGASFAVLFEVNRYTLKAAFDPIDEPVYWTRFALGLIAGVLMAELVPADASEPVYHGVAKPTLALLGGFSASVLYRILVHLRNTVESFILPGSNHEFDPQGRTVRGELPDMAARDRLKVLASLIGWRRRLGSGATPEQLKEEIDGLLAELTAADEDRKYAF